MHLIGSTEIKLLTVAHSIVVLVVWKAKVMTSSLGLWTISTSQVESSQFYLMPNYRTVISGHRAGLHEKISKFQTKKHPWHLETEPSSFCEHKESVVAFTQLLVLLLSIKFSNNLYSRPCVFLSLLSTDYHRVQLTPSCSHYGPVWDNCSPSTCFCTHLLCRCLTFSLWTSWAGGKWCLLKRKLLNLPS